MYIHRDSLKHGVDSAYGAIENDAAQICADFKCPNPYLALESLRGPHEAWWLNAFNSEADTTRVVNAYAANRPLMEALGTISKRKASLIGKPIAGFGVYRPDLSQGPWSVAGTRFMVVTITRSRRPVEGAVWQTADSTLYAFRPVRTFEQAEALSAKNGARIFAVRPNWSMPAPEWIAADPEFWRVAPKPRQSAVTNREQNDRSPASIAEQFANALIAKDWTTCASLTDPEELARNKAAFMPIFQRDSSGQLASRILGTPRQLVISTLSDQEFNARLFAFFVATSSPGSALDRFQGIEIVHVANPTPDQAFVIYRWRLPQGERPIRGVQAMELRRVGGQWRLKMLADFEGLREMLAREYAR